MSSKSSQKILETEVLIVGGGLVGASLACLLGHLNIQTILVDQRSPDTFLNQNQSDRQRADRTTAVSYGSRLIFEQVGLWTLLEDHAHPIEEIHVFNGEGPGFLKYGFPEKPPHPFGYIVGNQELAQALYVGMRQRPSVSVMAPAEIRDLETNEQKVRASLATGRPIWADLCVGSDGAGSLVREKAGIQTTVWPYDQVALVFTVSHQNPHQNRAFEYFLPSGPLAFLPMANSCSSVVWAVPSTAVKRLQELSPQAFIEELMLLFPPLLGKMELISQRWTFPLKVQLAHQWVGPRLALAGDSGHLIHPVAGQGFNSGLRDAAVLGRLLETQVHLGLDLGAGSLLKTYQRQRRLDILSMTAFTDGMVRLFSNESSLLKWMRGLGLNFIDSSPLVKKLLTRHAMGLLGSDFS